MRPFRLVTQLVVTGVLAIALNQPVQAQIEIRRGILPFNQLLTLSQDSSTTLSQGFLADLQVDRNFNGDFQTVFNTAANILNNYTVVSRGGYFPENAGIPREQQLTTAEAVYYIFELENGNQLYLYRSPTENTSRYFIRQATNDVMTQ